MEGNNKKSNVLKRDIFSVVLDNKTNLPLKAFLFFIAFVVTLALAYLSFKNAFYYEAETSTAYRENSNLDYKVYLKENNFYESPYLEKDKLYIANLIKDINVDFSYNFSIDDLADLNFTYSIIGNLVIGDGQGAVYFEKEYILLGDKTVNLANTNSYTLRENVVIDYAYYNQLANSFKTAYGLDTDSKLNVYLKINKSIYDDGIVRLNQSDNMSLVIPLSERAINIGMNYKEINQSNYITSNSKTSINNYLLIVLSVIFVVIALALLMVIIKILITLRNIKSKYDRYVEKIITSYDRLIVETETEPDLDNYNIIVIGKFEELLDVRDNLKLPVMHYNVIEHKKDYFFIRHDNDLYLFVTEEKIFNQTIDNKKEPSKEAKFKTQNKNIVVTSKVNEPNTKELTRTEKSDSNVSRLNSEFADKFDALNKSLDSLMSKREKLDDSDLLNKIDDMSLDEKKENKKSNIPDLSDIELPNIKSKDNSDDWRF